MRRKGREREGERESHALGKSDTSLLGGVNVAAEKNMPSEFHLYYDIAITIIIGAIFFTQAKIMIGFYKKSIISF